MLKNLSKLYELRELQIYKDNEVSYENYVSELLEIQSTLANIVFGTDDHVRTTDVAYKIREIARNKGCCQDLNVIKAERSLDRLNKELAISMAGRKAERRALSGLKYCNRPISVFTNISLSNDEVETELDGLVLTDEGFIILEVKSAKDNITISDQGVLLYGNENAFHNYSIGEKMKKKRMLLRENLEKLLMNADVDIPVRLDSYIVFSQPRSKRIRITDNYRKEKYCFNNNISRWVDGYHSDVIYSDEEMSQLEEVVSTLIAHSKQFKVPFDAKEMIDDLITGYEVVYKDDVQEESVKKETKSTRFFKKVAQVLMSKELRPVLVSSMVFAVGALTALEQDF